jgi:hypothetical protein
MAADGHGDIVLAIGTDGELQARADRPPDEGSVSGRTGSGRRRR